MNVVCDVNRVRAHAPPPLPGPPRAPWRRRLTSAAFLPISARALERRRGALLSAAPDDRGGASAGPRDMFRGSCAVVQCMCVCADCPGACAAAWGQFSCCAQHSSCQLLPRLALTAAPISRCRRRVAARAAGHTRTTHSIAPVAECACATVCSCVVSAERVSDSASVRGQSAAASAQLLLLLHAGTACRGTPAPPHPPAPWGRTSTLKTACS